MISGSQPARLQPIPWHRTLFSGAALILLLAMAWGLRWRYATEISLYVDEFTTLWAARQVQAQGLPLMPSGVLYTRGLLASYIEALFLTIGGFSYLVGRLPSILFGLATILITFAIGRRDWPRLGWAVGWLAAVGLTLLPEAIMWSGRARFYAQLQCFALLTVWAAFRAITAQEDETRSTAGDWRTHLRNPVWQFPCFFTLALFSQEETLLLYPATLLAGFLWQGWSYFTRRTTLISHLICLAMMGVRFAIEIFGQPGYFETIQAERPYVGLIFDLRGAWQTYAPQLVAPDRLPWTLGGLMAVMVALLAAYRTRGRLQQMAPDHQATLFYTLHLAAVLVAIFSFVGTTWRDARYLFIIQPLWLLVGTAGLTWLLERGLAWAGTRGRFAGLAGMTLLVGSLGWSPAQTMLTQQVEGYDQALARLAQERQPGEQVLSPQPPACALVLGHCEYYAVQRGYEEYVIARNGRLIDRWTGSTLLHQTKQLVELLQAGQPLWFVIDSLRLATRYEADFVTTVIEQFSLITEERGVLVLRAEGWRTLPAYVAEHTLATPLLFEPLALTGWQRSAAEPGQELHVRLHWQAAAPIAQQYNTSLRLVSRDGTVVAQQDGPPAGGLIPTTLLFENPRPDLKTLVLPAELPAGRYRLELVVYELATLLPVGDPIAFDWLSIGELPEPTAHWPALTAPTTWANGLQLAGLAPLPAQLMPGDTLELTVAWTSDQPILGDYVVFVHLVNEQGQLIAQRDQEPENGFYPTSAWTAGEQVVDVYTLTLAPDTPPGTYRVLVGWYDRATGERLRTKTGEDMSLLATLEVIESAARN